MTLDQIGSHQYFVKQRVEDIDKRIQYMEVCPSPACACWCRNPYWLWRRWSNLRGNLLLSLGAVADHDQQDSRDRLVVTRDSLPEIWM